MARPIGDEPETVSFGRCERCKAPLRVAELDDRSSITIVNSGFQCGHCGHVNEITAHVSTARVGGRLEVVVQQLSAQQLIDARTRIQQAFETPGATPESVAAAVEPEAPGLAQYIRETCDKYQGVATVFGTIIMVIISAVTLAIMLAQGGDPPPASTNPVTDSVERLERGEVIETPPIGRRDPCFCGSGKRYKNCHGIERARYRQR